MDSMNQMATIFGGIFTLSNKFQQLGDKMDDYMSMKQWLLIAAIEKNGKEALNYRELAGITGTSYQNVKKMAVILEKQGFLSLEKDPADARAVLVSPTPYCKEYFSERSGMEEEFLLSLFQGIDGKVVSDLCSGILRLNENVNALLGAKHDQEESIQREEGEGL